MSIINIRAALETALNSVSPSILTAWENLEFAPPAANVPYQRAYMLLAKPDNFEMGANYAELGILHVNLMYPKSTGSRVAAVRCELLRELFNRGATFEFSGTRVIVTLTPEIVSGFVQDDRFVMSVKVPFSSFIFRS